MWKVFGARLFSSDNQQPIPTSFIDFYPSSSEGDFNASCHGWQRIHVHCRQGLHIHKISTLQGTATSISHVDFQGLRDSDSSYVGLISFLRHISQTHPDWELSRSTSSFAGLPGYEISAISVSACRQVPNDTHASKILRRAAHKIGPKGKSWLPYRQEIRLNLLVFLWRQIAAGAERKRTESRCWADGSR